MGTLVAKAYPTKLMLYAADHTYVECGNGAVGWGCWGGKTGGHEINRGIGSTQQAAAIAGSKERAGITCYLVNGVCHQAANRVLFPAGKLVTAARGYPVSHALFGPYGRIGASPCFAPFDQQTSVSGDLPECLSSAPSPGGMPPPYSTLGYPGSPVDTLREADHFRALAALHSRIGFFKPQFTDSVDYQKHVFELEIRFRLGTEIGDSEQKGLFDAKDRVEENHATLTSAFAREELSPAKFISGFNEMTLRFQDDVANALSPDRYRQFMDMERDEKVVLADPDIVADIHGQDVVEEVYPELGRSKPWPTPF